MKVDPEKKAIQALGNNPTLNNFIKQFGVFVQGPNGYASLKRLIIDSGVKGVLTNSHINEEFINKNVSDVFSFDYGKNLPKKARSETGEYPVYGSNGVVGTHKESLINKKCIVIGRKGSAGALNICSNTGCWVTDVAYYVMPPDFMDLKYTYYLLQTLGLDQLGKGIKPGLNRNEAYALKIAYPSIQEQKRIVAKVDELLSLCDQLEAQQQQQANTLLKANTAAIQALLSSDAPQGNGKDRNSSGTNLANSKDDLKNNWQRLADNFHTLYGNTLPMPPGEGRQKKHLVGLENVKQLRNVILQLAVTGKLISQDCNEIPASELIENIEHTKQKLVKDKVIGKQLVFPYIPEDEIPFALPEGWSFIRLGQITNRIGSGSTPRGGKSAYVESGIPFLRSQNVWNDGLKLDDVAYIPDETHEKMSNTKVFPRDILLNITGASLGRCALIPDDFDEANVSQHVTIIRLTEPETRQYLHLCMLSPHTQNMVWGRQVGMAREGLSKKVLEQFEIPLPPLEEQKRIVEKVNALMSLCDKLEQQLTTSYDEAENLISSTIRALVA